MDYSFIENLNKVSLYIEEIKKFIDGDRIKEANKLFTRLETDIKELKAIKALDPCSINQRESPQIYLIPLPSNESCHKIKETRKKI